jgi:hypothetical protein
MRPELTSAEIAMSGSYFDDVLLDPRRYGLENTTDKVRRPGCSTKTRRRVHRAYCQPSGSNPHGREVAVPLLSRVDHNETGCPFPVNLARRAGLGIRAIPAIMERSIEPENMER